MNSVSIVHFIYIGCNMNFIAKFMLLTKRIGEFPEISVAI